MHRVERDIVHGVHERLVFGRRGLVAAVALEREVVRRVLLLDVLDRHAPLDAADGEAVCGGEAGHYARLPLERRDQCLGGG